MDKSKILREVIIILLLVIVIIFAFGILFYDCISADKETIYSQEYVTDTNVSNVLNEIKENSGVDIENSSSNQVLKSYSINQEDLTEYAQDNSYESGKKDPFASDSEEMEEQVTTKETTAKSTNSQANNYVETNKDSKNKTEEKSNSTPGTFFEKKNSK